MMNLARIATRMQGNVDVVASLVTGVTPEQARWRPAPEAWSMLEVVNHLYDEDREDFRARIDIMLHHPADPFPAIDPASWVTARRYNERDPAASLADFVAERAASLVWLRALDAPAWETARTHPVAGRFTAGDLLAAWLAHDFLHIRQLNELHYLYHAEQVAPRRLDYAGEW